MQVNRFNSHLLCSQFAAREIVQALKKNKYLTLCMASGHSPALACEWLVRYIQEENIDYSGLFFIGLDEWVALPAANPGSCYYSFLHWLIKPLQLPETQYHLFNGEADNLEEECLRMGEIIAAHNGIDIMLVGIGMNGHIGFNEPGTPFNTLCFVAELEAVTVDVGKKYFTQTEVPNRGITIGLGHLTEAGAVYLIANGEHKAAVIKQAVEGEVGTGFPASILQQHKNAFVLVDEAAAGLLKKE